MYGLDYPYYGAVPQMQARLNQLEGYQAQQQQLQAQQMQQQVSPLRGRTVTCVEEVKAAQVMLDFLSCLCGSQLCKAYSKVYCKFLSCLCGSQRK